MTLQDAYNVLKNEGLLSRSAETKIKVYITYKLNLPKARSHWDACQVAAAKHGISPEYVNKIIREIA